VYPAPEVCLQEIVMDQRRRAMGIRATAARVETLDRFDRTLQGTYWFDLRTRRPAAARVKRVVDVIGSLLSIVLFAPLMLLMAALVKLSGAGPVTIEEPGIGFRGNEFGMYGFRRTRFLRRSRLAALPRLFNVLEGTMSLVGPAPLRHHDSLPLHAGMRRFSVLPGITGLAQVSATTDDERMQLDREYINQWSLWLDLKILLRTIAVLLS
jgi:putative colanic acid biosynthesis UDP-glucose lipid carrier transferase